MIEVTRLDGGIGAEVRGVDLRGLDDAGFAVLHRAFLEHSVLVVRDQRLEMGDYLAYSRRFGVVRPHLSKSTRHAGFPEVTVMGENAVRSDGTANDTVYKRGLGWHTDLTSNAAPPRATQLYALEIPSRGGDTLFLDLHAAYERLPAALKARIARLRGGYRYGGRSRFGVELIDAADRDRPPQYHPLLRRHPETGRPVLYLDPSKILDVEGLAPGDSDALIEELLSHVIRPTEDLRFRWQVGDALIWDNRCTLHSATADYPLDERRIHWRVTIEEPEGVVPELWEPRPS